jgi:hypothetical protein
VLPAQILASERGLIAQTVDGTRITVEFARPRARGRTNIYGGMEAWNLAWTPGADSATTLDVSRPVHVLGKAVAKGRYSVWLVPREHSAWTLVLDPRSALFHTAHPDSTAAQIRVGITPHTVPQTEALTWSFATLDVHSTTLEMRWGTMGVAIPIEITPTYPLTVTAAEVAPFVGVYDFTWGADASQEKPARFTISVRDNKLIGTWTPDQPGGLHETQLLPASSDTFMRTSVNGGQIWSLVDGSRFVFTRANGVITGFELRQNNFVDARGVRRK